MLHAGQLEVNFDYALFKYNEDSTFIELYYTMLDSTLTYNKIDTDLMSAQVNFEINLNHLQKGTNEKAVWYHNQTKNIQDSNLIYSLFGVKQIILPKGDYSVEVKCSEEGNPDNSQLLNEELSVRTYDDESPSLSKIEMANMIENKNEEDPNLSDIFLKGQYYVIPNPSLEYYSSDPNLKFYFETYNLPHSDKEFVYVLSILDGASREIFKTKIKTWKNTEDHGRTLSVPLDLVPTGVYFLKLELVEQFKKPEVLDFTVKKFYYYNEFLTPELKTNFTEDQLFEMSEFATMDEKTANYEFRKYSIIARPIEIDQWEKMTELPGKQRFLYRFWSMRDVDSSTVSNEAKIIFDERVKYANTFFNYGINKVGWNTDRGRILLKYGEPTQLDRQAANGTDRAYEEWFYAEIQGGVKFNFVDVMGYGNYILVHSDALGEIRNSNWYNDYVKNQKASGFNNQ